jgi:hypothetical protein
MPSVLVIKAVVPQYTQSDLIAIDIYRLMESAQELEMSSNFLLREMKQLLELGRKVDWAGIHAILDEAVKYKWERVNKHFGCTPKSCEKRIRDVRRKIRIYTEPRTFTVPGHPDCPPTNWLGDPAPCIVGRVVHPESPARSVIWRISYLKGHTLDEADLFFGAPPGTCHRVIHFSKSEG